MSLRRSFVAVLSLISSVALSWSALAAPTSAAPALKKNYTSGISPPTAVADTPKAFTFTITNCLSTTSNPPGTCPTSSQQTLGSANITVPSSYKSVSSVVATAPAGKTWLVTSDSATGNFVKLRSDTQSGLNPGESVSVTITATPTCPDGETWATAVKQSNDFSGTGNDFKIYGSDPSVTVTGCPDHLVFTQQPSADSTHPASITAGQIITPVFWVAVKDSAGSTITTAKVAVTMDFSVNPGSGTLFGTKTRYTTSDGSATGTATGVAVFDDLIIDKAGNGYKLKATAASLPDPGPIISYAFNITGIAVQCTSSPCTLNTGNLNTGPNKQDDTFGGLSVPVSDCTDVCPFLSIEEDPGSFCNGTCIGSTILFFPPSNATGRITAVGEWDKSILVVKGAAQYNVYKLVGITATQLPDCSNPDPAPDEASCVVSRNKTGAGDLVITVSFPGTGDPRWGTN